MNRENFISQLVVLHVNSLLYLIGVSLDCESQFFLEFQTSSSCYLISFRAISTMEELRMFL